MRFLGVDFGRARTGLAIGDDETFLTFPLQVIEEVKMEKLVERVALVIKDEGIDGVVVGAPLRITGDAEMGETETLARQFAQKLKDKCGLPVELEDERFSTAYAERMSKESGTAAKIGADAIAAAAILETWLGRHVRRNE